MTKSDPIDRALERLEVADREAETLFASTSLRYRILTDLYNAGVEDGQAFNVDVELRARLAAVVELGEEWLKSDAMGIWGDHLLALARCEGGEQAERTTAPDRGSDPVSVPTEPAAPDAECQHCKGAGCVACSASHLPDAMLDEIVRDAERAIRAERDEEFTQVARSHDEKIIWLEAEERRHRETKARLAAVVERCEAGIEWEPFEGAETVDEFRREILDIAHGEGGHKQQIPSMQGGSVDIAKLAQGGEQATGKDQPETDSGDPVKGHRKPAAPAPNDHSYPAEQLRHAIWAQEQRQQPDAMLRGTGPAADKIWEGVAKAAEGCPEWVKPQIKEQAKKAADKIKGVEATSKDPLDEIVREAHVELSRHFSGQFALIQRVLRAACIRAREMKELERAATASTLLEVQQECIQANAKLEAVVKYCLQADGRSEINLERSLILRLAKGGR